MYTFYFQALPSGKFLLKASKALAAGTNSKLGTPFNQVQLDNLVSAGYRVVIDPHPYDQVCLNKHWANEEVGLRLAPGFRAIYPPTMFAVPLPPGVDDRDYLDSLTEFDDYVARLFRDRKVETSGQQLEVKPHAEYKDFCGSEGVANPGQRQIFSYDARGKDVAAAPGIGPLPPMASLAPLASLTPLDPLVPYELQDHDPKTCPICLDARSAKIQARLDQGVAEQFKSGVMADGGTLDMPVDVVLPGVIYDGRLSKTYAKHPPKTDTRLYAFRDPVDVPAPPTEAERAAAADDIRVRLTQFTGPAPVYTLLQRLCARIWYSIKRAADGAGNSAAWPE